MKIDFVSDIACPWCAVGLNALERALAALGPEIPVELEFQPFELNPDMPAEGVDMLQYLAARYGLSEAQVRANQATLRDWAWHVTLADLAWGALVTSSGAAIAFRVLRPGARAGSPPGPGPAG